MASYLLWLYLKAGRTLPSADGKEGPGEGCGKSAQVLFGRQGLSARNAGENWTSGSKDKRMGMGTGRHSLGTLQ